jgi:hypothetical protein
MFTVESTSDMNERASNPKPDKDHVELREYLVEIPEESHELPEFPDLFGHCIKEGWTMK